MQLTASLSLLPPSLVDDNDDNLVGLISVLLQLATSTAEFSDLLSAVLSASVSTLVCLSDMFIAATHWAEQQQPTVSAWHGDATSLEAVADDMVNADRLAAKLWSEMSRTATPLHTNQQHLYQLQSMPPKNRSLPVIRFKTICWC